MQTCLEIDRNGAFAAKRPAAIVEIHDLNIGEALQNALTDAVQAAVMTLAGCSPAQIYQVLLMKLPDGWLMWVCLDAVSQPSAVVRQI